MVKPRKLKPGDRVAAVSLSWGGPGAFPHRYEAGKLQFEQEFGIEVVETKHALRDPDWLYRNPEARAEDLMTAFADPQIDGIISTIGGDDSMRILPFVDLDVIRNNPKVFMGYSDTTVSHLACFKAELVSFYGPAFMAGFAENVAMFPYMVKSVRQMLFSTQPVGLIEPNHAGWTVERLNWGDPTNQATAMTLNPCTGWRYHQTDGVVEGRLFGGCAEVLDWLRGTAFWPSMETLRGAILFLETSQDAPPPAMVTGFIRSLAALGCLEILSGILLGRPGGQIAPERFESYETALCKTVREEYGLKGLALVTNMDIGHTDPMFVMPMGLTARIDSRRRQLSILESAVVESDGDRRP